MARSHTYTQTHTRASHYHPDARAHIPSVLYTLARRVKILRPRVCSSNAAAAAAAPQK